MVVTIIVLLLLAGITISLLFGQNGVIIRANETKVASRYAQVLDLEQMRFASNLVNSKTDGDIEGEKQFLIRLAAQGLYIEGVDEYVDGTRTRIQRYISIKR